MWCPSSVFWCPVLDIFVRLVSYVVVGETAGEGAAGQPESSRVHQSEREPETNILSQSGGVETLTGTWDTLRNEESANGIPWETSRGMRDRSCDSCSWWMTGDNEGLGCRFVPVIALSTSSEELYLLFLGRNVLCIGFWTHRLIWICVWRCRLHWWWRSLHHNNSIFQEWEYGHFFMEVLKNSCQEPVRQNSGHKNMLTHEYFRDMFSLSSNFFICFVECVTEALPVVRWLESHATLCHHKKTNQT